MSQWKIAGAMNEHHGRRFPNELKTREGITIFALLREKIQCLFAGYFFIYALARHFEPSRITFYTNKAPACTAIIR